MALASSRSGLKSPIPKSFARSLIHKAYFEGSEMSTIIYNTPYCQLKHLKAQNAILCQWKQFCRGDDYREPLKFATQEIEKYQITTWITDTTNGFESEEADTKWLLNEFVPSMISSSIEKVVFIIANDSPLIHEIKAQEVALSLFFEVELVESLNAV